MVKPDMPDSRLGAKEIAAIAAVVIVIIIAAISITHVVRQNSPQVVSVMKAQPGAFGKGAWMKAHHMGIWANSKGPTSSQDDEQSQDPAGTSSAK